MLQVIIAITSQKAVQVLAFPQGVLAAARQQFDYQGEDEAKALLKLCDCQDAYFLESILDIEYYLKTDLTPEVRKVIENERKRFL